jgi:hypothetical protein
MSIDRVRIDGALWYSDLACYLKGWRRKTVKKDDFYQYAVDGFGPVAKMLAMVPADKLDWKPGPNFMSMGELICHLSDGIGTELRMLIQNTWPKLEEMNEAMKGKIPTCNVQEALSKLEKDKTTLREVLAGVTEDEFANKIVATPWGWKGVIEKMSFDFREHFTNHKMQLFTYLKLLGFPVNTETLYFG